MLRRTFASSALFARTLPALAVSPYLVFIIKNKADPNAPKLIAERGKYMAAKYHALTPAEKAELVAEAAKMPSFKRKASTKTKKKKNKNGDKPKAKRPPSAYNLFIRDNFHLVKDLPFGERLKVLAAKFKAQKQ